MTNKEIQANLTPLGYQQISPVTAATGLTPPAGATVAIIRCLTNSVRWRDDGTNPTAAIGVPMLPADPPFIYTGNLGAIVFIQTAVAAELDVSYYSVK